MKYVFVQLFPALNETRAAHTGAENFDAFKADAGASSDDGDAERADAESDVAPISS